MGVRWRAVSLKITVEVCVALKEGDVWRGTVADALRSAALRCRAGPADGGGPSSAYAQFDRGTISGTIKDPQGGVVPGVTVVSRARRPSRPARPLRTAAASTPFPNLQSGRYDISAELQGFKKINGRGVQLDAAASLNLDFALETGS